MKRSLLLLLPIAVGCGASRETQPATLGPATFHVEITAVDGSTTLPTADAPLPANHGDTIESWDFTIEARTPTGEIDTTFDERFVRVSVRPGTVLEVHGDGASGRNAFLKKGKASGSIDLTAIYGPTRMWVEDQGYKPAKLGTTPKCSNSKDDDGDGDIDFPADTGCAFADDDDEEGGKFSAGTSPPVQYALPKISDVRGDGSATPYPFEAIEINTARPEHLVVTRVASDGFYVTDVAAKEMANGYNSIFAFNFSTPDGMRVCDKVTYLSGTANDFFGFTELSFPSYQLSYPIIGKDECEVPEPIVILSDGPPPVNITPDAVAMQRLQSSLVRLVDVTIAKNFGPGLAKNNVFKEDASSCDFNGDGQIDFTDPLEGNCATACDASPDCSEWTSYSARGDVKVSQGTAATMIKIQTGTVAGFDPVANRGTKLDAVTGTMRKFSGGSLNWTVEVRCPDDLVCKSPGCVLAPVSSKTACVSLRTQADNDQGTN